MVSDFRKFSTYKHLEFVVPNSSTLGAFFLLSCAKETSGSVRSFLEKVVLDREAKTLCEAIQKFSVLWQVRYDVWPRMAERAQKKFNMEDETDQGGQVGRDSHQLVHTCKLVHVHVHVCVYTSIHACTVFS